MLWYVVLVAVSSLPIICNCGNIFGSSCHTSRGKKIYANEKYIFLISSLIPVTTVGRILFTILFPALQYIYYIYIYIFVVFIPVKWIIFFNLIDSQTYWTTTVAHYVLHVHHPFKVYSDQWFSIKIKNSYQSEHSCRFPVSFYWFV